jgi:flagellar assembly factor FliW
MPQLETKHFGSIAYEAGAELEFPAGLPGFESRRRFLALRFAQSDPLVYLQSMEDPALCFLTVPVLVADKDYRLQVDGEDLETIGLTPGEQPQIGRDVLCLAVLSIREDADPTVNLLAPLVINLKNHRAVQAVHAESGYSHQHALFPQEAALCS